MPDTHVEILPAPTRPLAEGVRIAQVSEIDQLMELALQGCEENGFVGPSVSKMLQELWTAVNRHAGVVGVIGALGSLEGAVLLRIGEMWYSDFDVLEEKAIFIHPKFRAAKGGRARRLCEFSKLVSDRLDIPLIIGVLSNARTEGKMRLYERQFGKPAGGFFLYNAKTGQPGFAENG